MTRILQESVGGNSRTTLIINCSPAFFNGSETISTLRFGVRAKTIKNTVKVNAELPPSELKALLKQAKLDLSQAKGHSELLEAELCKWRIGINVPESEWTLLKNGRANVVKLDVIASESVSVSLLEKEREEFLRRENELADQLADKESQLIDSQTLASKLRAQLASFQSIEVPALEACSDS